MQIRILENNMYIFSPSAYAWIHQVPYNSFMLSFQKIFCISCITIKHEPNFLKNTIHMSQYNCIIHIHTIIFYRRILLKLFGGGCLFYLCVINPKKFHISYIYSNKLNKFCMLKIA